MSFLFTELIIKPDRVISTAIILLFTSYLSAQNTPYLPLGVEAEMVVDGKLEEPFWEHAPIADDFMQVAPITGAEPSERTELKLAYNKEFLYVGVRCYDSDPSKLIKLNLERDFETSQEDGVAFVIDTYNDKSSGLVFITNLYGARWDEEFTSDGGNENDDFNTYWDTQSHVDSLGYTTEFRIPFSSLRFELKGDTVRMGFKMIRLIKRKNEYLMFPPCDPKIDNPYFKVSIAREMELYHLENSKPFYITPYAIANYIEQSKLNEAGDAYITESELLAGKDYFENDAIDKIISNVGIDIKYGLSKNFTLDFTLNTDFAQTEVDNVIINLSKYEVNLPEKRSFFLESKNYLGFSTTNGAQMFISRSIGNENEVIVPIIAGIRVTGKSNGWQMGTLNMQTKGITNDSIDPHNYFVFRTRKDIDSLGSFVGGIITNRMNTNSNSLSNQTIGIDAVKRLNSHITFVGAVTSTFINGVVEEFARSTYYNIAVFRSARTGFTYNYQMDFVGSQFNPEMGYIDDNDYTTSNGGIGYRMAGKPDGNIQFLYVFNNNSYRWKQSFGSRETFYTDVWPGLSFKSGAEINFAIVQYKIDSLFENWELDDQNAIAAGTYNMYTNSLNIVSPQKSFYTASIASSYGGFYGGDRLFISPELTVYMGKHFIVDFTYEYNNIKFSKYLDTDKSTLYETNLLRVSFSYLMNTQFSIKLFSQFDDLNNKISGNFRLRYNPREGTDLYVVFNQGLNTNRSRQEPVLPHTDQLSFTIKYLKTFAL